VQSTAWPNGMCHLVAKYLRCHSSPKVIADPLVEALTQGLRELGYVEGHNVGIESRLHPGADA